MARLSQKYGLLIAGIVIGILYGLVTRLFFGERATLASITYLFLIPVVLGVIPLIFANDEQIRSYRNIIFVPWLTIAAFFLTAMLAGLEEFICLLVLAGPFFILATLGAFIVRLIMIKRKRDRFLAVMLLPFLLSPVEELIKSPSETFRVESEIAIDARPETVWNNIVEVPDIGEDEYTEGFFNRIGIPRPVSAAVDRKESGGTRIGSFEGGLKFVETLKDFEPNRRVSFSINVDPGSVGPRIFDQHVLNGSYFTFVDATYEISEEENGRTNLKLSSRYRLTSKVNLYGKFWGDLILRDFQDRLLLVIEKRCEAD